MRLRSEGLPGRTRCEHPKLRPSCVLVRRSPQDVDMPEIGLCHWCPAQEPGLGERLAWRKLEEVKDIVRGLCENFWNIKGVEK